MGNCGTREESAVVSTAQVQQQLPILSSSASIKNGQSDKKHTRSISDLSDPTSTPRNFEDSRKNSLLYTHVIAFTLYELETITKSFRSDYILGEGGFGTVYKGYIDENVRVGLKSIPVAVKVLNKEGLQGHREWLTEVNFLGQLRHPNLVKLIGYCCEDDHRLLVYEFMFRGSLENHLFRTIIASIISSCHNTCIRDHDCFCNEKYTPSSGTFDVFQFKKDKHRSRWLSVKYTSCLFYSSTDNSYLKWLRT